jgi:hypothetical protein
MNWVKSLFVKADRAHELPSHSTGFHDLEGDPEPLDVKRSDLRAARELIYSSAKQTALLYGIPQDWLSFEVLTIADDEMAYFQLQVVVLEWDEHLFVRAYAFEVAVMKRIAELNMTVARAVRAVLWRTRADAGCPHDELPGPEAWTPEVVARRNAQRLSGFLMPVPVDARPLTDSEKRVLVRPDALETVAPAFFATSAMGDVVDASGRGESIDTEAEFGASASTQVGKDSLGSFSPTVPQSPREA